MLIEKVDSFKAHSECAWALSLSFDAKYMLSCSSDKKIILWKIPSMEIISEFENAHDRTVRNICFSPFPNKIASCGFDGVCNILRKELEDDFELIATLEGHENEVKCVTWHSNGQLLATCGRDKSVWIWEAQDDNEFECLSILQEHSQDVKKVLWHPSDEILLSCSYDNTIRVWKADPNDDEWFCDQVIQVHESIVWAIDFNAIGDYFVSVSEDSNIAIFKMIDSKYENIIKCKIGKEGKETMFPLPAYCVSWNKWRPELIVCSGADRSISIYKLSKNDEEKEILELMQYYENASVVDINDIKWIGENEFVTCDDDGILIKWHITLYLPWQF